MKNFLYEDWEQIYCRLHLSEYTWKRSCHLLLVGCLCLKSKRWCVARKTLKFGKWNFKVWLKKLWNLYSNRWCFASMFGARWRLFHCYLWLQPKNMPLPHYSPTLKRYLPVVSSLLDVMEYIYNIPYPPWRLFNFGSQEDARHSVHLGKITDTL